MTFTATVAPFGSITPTGKVNFTWSRFTNGSATLDSNGVATLIKTNLNADVYPLTAVYGGDANNPPSTSAIANQVVNRDYERGKDYFDAESVNARSGGHLQSYDYFADGHTNGTSDLHGGDEGIGDCSTQQR